MKNKLSFSELTPLRHRGLFAKFRSLRFMLVMLMAFLGVNVAWGATHTITPNVTGTNYEVYSFYKQIFGSGYNSVASSFSDWVSGSGRSGSSSSYTEPTDGYWLDGNNSSSLGYGIVQLRSANAITFTVTNCVSVALLQNGLNASRSATVSVKKNNIEVDVIKENNGNAVKVVEYSGLSASDTYVVTVSTNNSGNNSAIYQIRFEAPASAKYTVTLNPNGGTCSTENLTEASAGAGVTLPSATPADEATQEFLGWSTTSTATSVDATMTAGKTYKPTKNETLYAIYGPKTVKSAIVYANTKGATNSNPTQYTEGVGIAEFAALEDVTGFHFTGWNPSSISASATGEQTITAEWEAAAAPCFTFTPSANSGNLNTGDVVGTTVGGTMKVYSCKYPDTDSSKGNSIKFTGSGLGLTGGAADVLSVELSDASFKENTKITITLNLATKTDNKDYGVKLLSATGDEVALLAEKNPNAGDYVKSYKVTASDKLNGSDVFRIQRNNTCYIKSISIENCGSEVTKYHVTYAKGEGEVTGTVPTQADLAEGKTFEVAGKGDLAWVGHEFTGWNDGSADYAPEATYTMGTSDVTLTAQWNTLTAHTVTYALGDGATGTLPTEANHYKGATFTLAAQGDIEKALNDFAGWNDGTTTYDAGATYTMPDDNVTLTAVWTPRPASSEKQLTRVKFSNNFDAFVKESDHSVTAYYMGETAPTVVADSWVVSEKATAAVADNKIVVTAEDGTTQDYAITLTQVTPATAGEYTFDGAESWVKTGYTYSSTKGWPISKSLDEPTANKMRIAEGWNRVNFFVAACENITLYTASGISSDRAIEVYRNGVKLTGEGIPTTAPKYNANGTAKITIPGDIQNPSYITIVNKGSGDGGFGKAEIKEYIKSTDATLSDLTVNGVTVEGFDAATETYNVELPFGTVDVPTVAATKNDEKASDPVVTPPASLPGATTVVVTAEDGTTTKTYTINFTVLTTHYVAKIGETKYETLAAAIAAVPTDGATTITLIDNTTENVIVPAGANIILNMANFTLSGGSVATNGNKAAIVNNGTIVINGEGATIKREDDDTERTTSSSYYVIDNQGTMTINAGVTVTNNSGVNEGHKGSSLIRNGEVTANASLTIDGATLVQPNFNVIKDGGNGSVLVIKSGTIGTTGQLNYAVLSYGNVTVEGGVVNGPLCFRSYDADACDATIKGGTINGNITVETYPGNTPDALSSLTITAGTINGTIATGIGNGTTFTTDATAKEHGEVAISGGIFSNPVVEAYCAEGFGPKANGDGTYGVKVVHTFSKWDGESINFEKKNAADKLEFTVYSTTSGGKQNGTTALKKDQQIDRTTSSLKDNVLQASYFAIKFEKDVKQVKILAYNGNTGRTLSSVQVSSDADLSNPTYGDAGFTLTTNTLETTYDYEFVIDGIFEKGKYYFIKTSNSVSFFDIFYTLAPEKSAEPAVATLVGETVCLDGTFAALDAVTAAEATYNYQWFKDGEAFATTQTINPVDGGEYYCKVTNHAEGYRDNVAETNKVTLVRLTEGTEITDHSSAFVRGAVGETATLEITASGVNLAYVWYTCDEDGSNAVVIAGAEAASYVATIEAGTKYVKVVVTGDCGNAEQIFTIAEKVVLPQVDVTETMSWDWTLAGNTADGFKSTEVNQVMANIEGVQLVDGFNSQALVMGNSGDYAYRNNSNKCFQGKSLKFHTTVPGFVTINARKAGNGCDVTIGTTDLGELTTTPTDYTVFVPAGDVEISVEGAQPVRIFKMTFTAADAEYTRDVVAGNYSGFCINKAVDANMFVGAEFYTTDYKTGSGSAVTSLTLREVDHLEAGVGYICLATANKIYMATNGESQPAATEGTIIGAYERTLVPENAGMFVVLSNKLYECGTNCHIKAGSAYINMGEVSETPSQAPGRRRVVGSTNATTGLENIELTEDMQKLLINGELFIIRGGKMFNAAGLLVK